MTISLRFVFTRSGLLIVLKSPGAPALVTWLGSAAGSSILLLLSPNQIKFMCNLLVKIGAISSLGVQHDQLILYLLCT